MAAPRLRSGRGGRRAAAGAADPFGPTRLGRERSAGGGACWGESPPPTAQKMLHNQGVRPLRQVLGRHGRLETHGRPRTGLKVWPRASGMSTASRELVGIWSGRRMVTDPEARSWRRCGRRSASGAALRCPTWAMSPSPRRRDRPGWEERPGGREFEVWGRGGGWCWAGTRISGGRAGRPPVAGAAASASVLHGQTDACACTAGGRQAGGARGPTAGVRATLVDEDRRRTEASSCVRCRRRSSLRTRRSLHRPGHWTCPGGTGRGVSPILAGRSREARRASSRSWADACDGRGGPWSSSRVPRGHRQDAAGPQGAGPRTLCGAGWPCSTWLRAICSPPSHRRRTANERALAHRGTTPTTRPARCSLAPAALHGLRRRAQGGCWSSSCTGGPEPPASFRRSTGAPGLALGPLGSDAVAEIARLYVPEGVRAAPERCPDRGERSGPAGPCHRLAAELGARGPGPSEAIGGEARAAPTNERRRALVGRGGALRRSAPASSRWTTARAAATGERTPTHRSAAVCPFLGLAHVRRGPRRVLLRSARRLVAALVARLVGSPLVAVLIGPSGTAGSPRRCGQGCSRRSPAAVLPGSGALAPGADAPGAGHPLAQLERVLPQSDEARGARGRPVRGGVHALPRRGRGGRGFLGMRSWELAEGREAERPRVVLAMARRLLRFTAPCTLGPRAGLAGASPVLVGPNAPRRAAAARIEEAGTTGSALLVEPIAHGTR